MTAVDQAVAVMEQAKLEILGLRAENTDLYDVLKETRRYIAGPAVITDRIDAVLARAEARRA